MKSPIKIRCRSCFSCESKLDERSIAAKVAPTKRRPSAFTPIEVLLSLGILSVALLIVFGILTPFMDRTGEVVENGNVNRITDRISAEIEQLSFQEVINVLNQNTGLYASREGDRLLLATDPELETRLPEAERHYAITLTRNEDLSPVSRDSSAGYLCFQIKVERLLHGPDGSLLDNQLNLTQAIFNTAIRRTDS